MTEQWTVAMHYTPVGQLRPTITTFGPYSKGDAEKAHAELLVSKPGWIKKLPGKIEFFLSPLVAMPKDP